MNTVFEENANEYDAWFDENRHLYDSEVDAVRSMLDEDKTYIEVGVGTGLFATRLGITEGIEPCNEMGEIATKRGIHVLEATAEHLPYAHATLDGILMITVDCFVKDIMPVFNAAYNALRDGGSYVMAFLDRGTPLGQIYEDTKDDNIYYKDATFRSADEMREYLTLAGFKVVDSCQTVYTLDNKYQPTKEGTGEGVFAIIKAEKEI